MKWNIGFKGERLGELMAPYIARKPGEIVIVHHITNFPDRVQLEVERRDSGHLNPTFERLILK